MFEKCGTKDTDSTNKNDCVSLINHFCVKLSFVILEALFSDKQIGFCLLIACGNEDRFFYF